MKMQRRIFCLVLGFTLLAGAAGASRNIEVISSFNGQAVQRKFAAGNNYALIIGINEYRHQKNLETAVNDAQAVARLLEGKYFFDQRNITVLKDKEATKERILQEFRDLVAQKVRKGDNVFIYYGGHGWYDDILETGYWVTYEATKNPATYLENNIIYNYITALDRKGVRHVLLVSDSCFAGSFAREHRDIETEIDDRYFREKYAKPSRSILASGGVEPVADGGKDGHSIFAYYFLKTLRENSRPYLSSKQLGLAVEQLVTRNSDQSPISRYIQGAGDEGGQFFFINDKSKITEPATIRPETFALPQEVKTTKFDDIRQTSKSRKAAMERWKRWQESREKEYGDVRQIDGDSYQTAQEKVVAWNRFLAALAQDNPYSLKDDEMRIFARSRVSHWEEMEPKPKYTAMFDSGAKESDGDGRFIAYDNSGVVYDTDTGLEWLAGPDDDTAWDEAKSWVENLSLEGGGWRMPTRKELRKFYKKGAGTRNMTPLLKTAGWCIWSSETQGSSSWAFYFIGGVEHLYLRSYAKDNRGFAVRSRR